MIRRGLDFLYSAAAALAALSLVGIFVVMMAQVVLRELGRQFPGADDLSAYLCVATTFFALAATFKRGEMIRVGILIERVGPRLRRAMEFVVLAGGAGLVAYVVWWTAQDMLFSYEIEEVAQGTVPFLLWIPKLALPIGAGLLLVAMLDEIWSVLQGETPSYAKAAEERRAAGDYTTEM